MNNNEILTLRMNMLGGMDTYVREVIGDDEIIDHWNIRGIPDGADEVDFMEIAEDDILWANICNYFGSIVAVAISAE